MKQPLLLAVLAGIAALPLASCNNSNSTSDAQSSQVQSSTVPAVVEEAATRLSVNPRQPHIAIIPQGGSYVASFTDDGMPVRATIASDGTVTGVSIGNNVNAPISLSDFVLNRMAQAARGMVDGAARNERAPIERNFGKLESWSEIARRDHSAEIALRASEDLQSVSDAMAAGDNFAAGEAALAIYDQLLSSRPAAGPISDTAISRFDRDVLQADLLLVQQPVQWRELGDVSHTITDDAALVAAALPDAGKGEDINYAAQRLSIAVEQGEFPATRRAVDNLRVIIADLVAAD